MIVARAVENVADDLQHGARAMAAGEINGVIETPGVAEIIIAEDAVAARANAVHTMQHLRLARARGHRRGIGREDAVLHDEGRRVEGDILHSRRSGPGAVAEEDARTVDMNLRGVAAERGAAARVEIHVAETVVAGGVHEIEAAPVARDERIAPDADALRLGALGHEARSVGVHGQRRAGREIDRRARFDGKLRVLDHGHRPGDLIRPARRRPSHAAANGAAHVRGHAAVEPHVQKSALELQPVCINGLHQHAVDAGQERDGASPTRGPRRPSGGHAIDQN